ncbi:DUF1801 domain-containing protein [Fulvivirga sedimenti]|uniref:DUF1801 domain-containing protein n=1 Tax=Fulvivirga sedimenti TaxID=2879465 RepID=A0A9X1KUU9_9BACT|nr:DUF1801 domain-containing protein [Fulvivirga sedimenti]MCA6073968.1 DUF1801 domain-containing protein [Fulvivirga sedimenti]
MAKNKTRETNVGVEEFINSFVDSDQKRQDSFELLGLMRDVSGFEPKMWGPSIIGFGSYHYKYASGHEGDAPLVGFSPRKNEFSLYVFTGLDDHEPLLSDLGKFRRGKACIYVKKLSDVNQKALTSLMNKTIEYLTTKYEKDQN